MEYRKLITFGKTSLVMSLPKLWVTAQKLKKGDIVYLTVSNESITIYPKEKEEEKEEEKERIIEIDNAPNVTIKRKTIKAYIENCDPIVFTGETLSKRSPEIREILHNFIALESIEESKNRMLAKPFVNIKEINLEHNLRRTDNMIRNMLGDLVSMALLNQAKKESLSQSLIFRDLDINKMVFLSFRYINYALSRKTPLNIPPLELLKKWQLFTNLERVGNDIKNTAKVLCKINKELLKKEIQEILQKCKKVYEETMEAVYTQNKELALKVSLERDPLLKQCEGFIESYKQNGDVISFYERMREWITNLNNIQREAY